jgi:hypothetical protein
MAQFRDLDLSQWHHLLELRESLRGNVFVLEDFGNFNAYPVQKMSFSPYAWNVYFRALAMRSSETPHSTALRITLCS